MGDMKQVAQKIIHGKCPAPPITHLTPQADRLEVLFDRVNGNPGPPATEYEIVNLRPPTPDDLEKENKNKNSKSDSTADRTGPAADTAPAAIQLPLTENEQFIHDAMTELKTIFPELMEHWLRNCVDLRMVADKWDLARTAWYIFENENIAPRKSAKIRVNEDENIDAQKEKFFNFEHEADNDYRFFAEMKLAEMFPRISTVSIRRILVDFRWHFMPTAISLAEALEEYFRRENKRWADFARLDEFYIDIPREGRQYRYWLQVITGPKYFNKKKGRMMGMPRMLVEQLRMVELWLTRKKKQRLATKIKREAEEEHARLVVEAKERGETAECVICGSDYRVKEDVVRCTNNHEYCFKCLRTVCWEIVSGQGHISLNGQVDCFDTSCDGKFTYGQLVRALEPEHLSRIEEIHLNSVIAAADLQNLMKCDHCLFMAIMDVPVEENRVFTCQNPKCGRQVCRLCGEVWKGHEGEKCRPKETSTESLARMKYEEALTKILTRTCPYCKSTLIKNEGCNMVVCRCRTKICYLCSAPNITYAHFCKHARAVGQKKCTECTGCVLHEDATARDEKKVKDLQLAREIDRLKQLEGSTVPKSPATPAPTPPASPAPGQNAAPAAPAPAPGPNPGQAFQRIFG